MILIRSTLSEKYFFRKAVYTYQPQTTKGALVLIRYLNQLVLLTLQFLRTFFQKGRKSSMFNDSKVCLTSYLFNIGRNPLLISHIIFKTHLLISMPNNYTELRVVNALIIFTLPLYSYMEE
jgi:hypothetical protein